METQKHILTNENEVLEIVSGDAEILDNRTEGQTYITVHENSKVIYKATGNTKKKLFLEKNAKLECYDLGKNIQLIAELVGEGASFNQKGLLVGTGDWTITAVHKAPNTRSDLQIRTLLNKNELAKVDGLIRIEKGCPKANGNQRIDTLMLDKSAVVKALPRLEIETDDVSCSHAATISQLDEESLFYLESRGIQKQEAKKLLVDGFTNFNEIITEMRQNK